METLIDTEVGLIGPTEALVEVRRRVGQDQYRQALMEHSCGACAVTGLSIPWLLRASHAKPWKDTTDRERLDVYNGLLLAIHLDALFDQGVLTFTDEGVGLFSSRFPRQSLVELGLGGAELRLRHVQPGHRPYLEFHRAHVFRQSRRCHVRLCRAPATDATRLGDG